MATAVERSAASGRSTGWLGENLPKLVLAPTFVITLFFVYGFILWTTFLSFTKSRFMPVTTLDGRPVGDGRPGPMSRVLMDVLRAHIEATTLPPGG